MLYAALAAAIVLTLGLGLWLVVGPGPRRARRYRRAQRLLEAGEWEPALALAEGLQAGGNAAWQAKLRTLLGECHHYAGDLALKERRYEDGLTHLLAAAPLLRMDPA